MTDAVSSHRRLTHPAPIEANLRLLDWGPRGATRAELNGRQILIDRGIPGEDVVASIQRKRKPWRGVVDVVVGASPDRVVPPCPYVAAHCGGCQWQHISYEAQLAAKRALVDRSMEAEGVDARVQQTHSMSDPWRYRHTASIAIGWEAGFRPRGRRGIVETRDCLISHPLIGCLADRVNDLLRSGRLPNYHGKVWLDCTVVGTQAEPSLQVLLQGIEGLTLDAHPELPNVAETLATVQGVRTIAFRHRSGEPIPLIGDLFGSIEVDGRLMHLPAGTFFQTNVTMLPELMARMRAALRNHDVKHLADVYGGVGTFGLPLAGSVKHVTLVELDPYAVEAARRTATDWRLDNITFVSRHAEKVLPDLPTVDAAIVDPPRSGLGSTVTDVISSINVPLVLYVSCAPGSLASDLAALQNHGYHVQSLEIFDFYPQTYHVESLAILNR
jgi:23S rRNA (uracil1939-C5)-methyltransferase